MAEPYDSREDTLRHIYDVRELLQEIKDDLTDRMFAHDQSKLEEPEKSVFDRVTPRLKELTYGSPEYFAQLDEMKVALDHHYAVNRHHPNYGGTVFDEEWRAVGGFEGVYEVSNFGQVRSLDRVCERPGSQGNLRVKGKILTPHLTPKGYQRVQLSTAGKPSNRLVHILVADAFIPKATDKTQVNHKDGDKQNNHFNNLEWTTPSENLQHAYDTGLRLSNAKYIVTCPELGIETIGMHRMAEELQKRGYPADSSGIWQASVGDNKTHCGLTFEAAPLMEVKEPQPYPSCRWMTLVDLVEMVCDWVAATWRHEDGDIQQSIEINQTRFGYSDELKAILHNTVEYYSFDEKDRP